MLPDRMDSLAERYLAHHGYAYVSEQHINEHLRCPICAEPFSDPVSSSCGHTFCTPCIRRWLLTARTCPVDRRPISSDTLTAASRVILDMLDELPCLCSLGCGWRGSRGSFKAHLAAECSAVELASAASGIASSSSSSSLSSLRRPGSTPSSSVENSPSHSRRSSYTHIAPPSLGPLSLSRINEQWREQMDPRSRSTTPWTTPLQSPATSPRFGPSSPYPLPPHLHERPGRARPASHTFDEAFAGHRTSHSGPRSRPPSRPASPDRYLRSRHGLACNICRTDIAGTRWKCLDCAAYNVCEGCYDAAVGSQHPFHLFVPLSDPHDAQPYTAGAGTPDSDLSLGFPWSLS